MNQAILDMAKTYYNRAGYFDTDVRDILMKQLAGGKLTKEDDKVLVKYCLSSQEKQMLKKDQSLSIREMKNTIFRLIGRQDKIDTSRWAQSTVSKDDMLAIYNFITALPAEFLAEDKSPVGDKSTDRGLH